MASRRPRSSRAAVVAAVLGLATMALGAPALGQADPGASSSSTSIDPSSTTDAVVDPVTTAADPAATTETSVAETPVATEALPVAQGTPFPTALVAPVPPTEGAPDTTITDLYVTDGVDPGSPDVVVQFRAPFTFAGTPYKVGVVIGDPSGTRLRTWLISNGPDALPYGRWERFEAGNWTELTPTPVRFEDGLMVITVPIAQAPAGGAVWAEIVENEAATPSHTTPYFARDALFGTAEAGTIPSAIFGRVFGLDGVSTDLVPELPAGGTLVSLDDRIAVTYPDPPPAEVIGEPVSESVDTVRIAPDYDAGAVITYFVRYNRTTGEVGLYDGFSPVPIDKSGDRSWVLQVPAAGEAGSLVIDRTKALEALGLAADAPIALGVSRELALDDGRVITAEGVLGTDAWLELAPASALPEVTTTLAPVAEPGAEATTTSSRLPLLIGAAVGLVGLLLLVLVVRRIRGRGDAGDGADDTAEPEAPKVDRMPWGSADGDLIITTTHEFDALIPADATPLPAPRPVDPAGPVPVAAAGAGVRILGEPVARQPAPTPAPTSNQPASPNLAASPVSEAAAPPAVPATEVAAAVAPVVAPPPPAAPPAAAAPVLPAVGDPAAPPVVGDPAGSGSVADAIPGGRSTLDGDPVWAPTARTPDPETPIHPPPVAPVVAAGATPGDPSPRSAPAPASGVALRVASEPAGPPAARSDAPTPAPPTVDDAEPAGGSEPSPTTGVDPMAALSALDQDMAELRRRVASLGDR